VSIPVSAKDLNRIKPEALHVDTNTSGQRHLVLCVPLQFFKLRLELRQLDDARGSGGRMRGCCWRAPWKGGAFQWVQVPPGNRSSRKQPEQSWR
jgi:hypothetical protein